MQKLQNADSRYRNRIVILLKYANYCKKYSKILLYIYIFLNFLFFIIYFIDFDHTFIKLKQDIKE